MVMMVMFAFGLNAWNEEDPGGMFWMIVPVAITGVCVFSMIMAEREEKKKKADTAKEIPYK